jgi:hypothetical protein
MEDDNIHVVEPDGSVDDSELSNLLDRWKIPVAVALGLLLVVVFVVSTQRGADPPPRNLPEAAPIVSTTQPTATTTSIPATTTSQTTTTLWLGAGTLLVRTRTFCTEINPPGLRTSDEWVESVFVESGPGFFVVKENLYDFFYEFSVEGARARSEQEFQLVAILDSISADLEHALDSVTKAFVALRDEAPDRWKHQVDLAERHCARAIMIFEAFVSALYGQ